MVYGYMDVCIPYIYGIGSGLYASTYFIIWYGMYMVYIVAVCNTVYKH